jgi:L-alanine-DL-glutamate epimerase-like enolase superfamily enzyme
MASAASTRCCTKARLKDKPAAVKIRFDNDRTKPDIDIPGDIAKARAVRRLVGDDFPLAFDANNGYSVGGAIRVGRMLEELGYWWFEEPVQHYHVKAMGEVAQRLDITVSAGEQTYTLAGLADLIAAGVRMAYADQIQRALHPAFARARRRRRRASRRYRQAPLAGGARSNPAQSAPGSFDPHRIARGIAGRGL